MAKPLQVQLSEPRKLDPGAFVVPPKWLVRQVSTNDGKRCRHYPSTWTPVFNHGHTGYPMGGADDYPWGMGDHSGAYEERWRREQREREERDNKIIVRGNLKEEQYRFWNGAFSPVSEIATCRWCRYSAYGAEQMHDHQSKTDHTRILRQVYDFARKLPTPMCFACGAKTRKERWGIPLCAANKCLNRWRVASIVEVSGTLLLYAKWTFKKGLLKEWLNEDRSEKRNLEANPRQFNWERASAY
jgi:hypothetical protein